MAKNLKLKIKNAQLAEALKINKLKSEPEPPKKKAPAKKATEAKKKVEEKKVEEKKELPPEEKPKAEVAVEKPKNAPEAKKTPVTTPRESKESAPRKRVLGELVRPAPKKEEKPKPKPKTTTPAKPKEPVADKSGFKRATPREFRDLKAAKRTENRPFDARDRQGLRDTEEGAWRRRRPRGKSRRQVAPEDIIRPKNLKVKLPITLKDLAQEMNLKASELIAKLFMQGLTITLNDYLDDETTIQLLGQEFGCEIEIDRTEEKRLRITDQNILDEIAEMPEEKQIARPPVIAFMGHVDHGKTSLIDSIRKSDLAAGESGAITQHIGAFVCHTEGGEVTILDTPGHEAFSEMRKRGATVTDVIVLVIAGDEGMKPQTEEALDKAIEANVPLVIAINKSDKPGFTPDTVYRQLADRNLLPEAWGGSTITVNCSAVTGDGIKNLLEMILLQAEVLELKAVNDYRARGTVLESELHKGLGITATLLVQNGTLNAGDAIVIDQIYGRVKTMHDEHAKSLPKAGPSTPVKVTGLSGQPDAGADFIVVPSEKEARKLCEERSRGQQRALMMQAKSSGLESLMQDEAERKEKKALNIILRADVQGSLEAIKSSLDKLPSDKVELNIISAGVGEISESDIDLASISSSIIIGFHTKIESRAEPIYKQRKIHVMLHEIIYHLIDEVKEEMTKLLDKIREEKEAGTAEVQAIFKASQIGVIAGCIVQDGIIKRNHLARLFRGEEKIWEGDIASLKRVKEDVKEVSKGFECGILLTNYNHVQAGDIIKTYEVFYTPQTL